MPKENNDVDDEVVAKHKTVQFDPRFPNQNQTYNCFVNYVHYYRCEDLLRDTPEKCEVFKKVFEAMCPNAWISRWDDMREAGTFPRPIIRVPCPDDLNDEDEVDDEAIMAGSKECP